MSIVAMSVRVRRAAWRYSGAARAQRARGERRGCGRDSTSLAGRARLATARWAGRATNCAHANSAPAHKLKQ